MMNVTKVNNCGRAIRMPFKMSDIKNALLNNWDIRNNTFTGCWEIFENSEYGRRIVDRDLYHFFYELQHSFPGITEGAIRSVLRNGWDYNPLQTFGMANGLSYHQKYRYKNFVLYSCAGENYSRPHYRIRFAKNDVLSETIIQSINPFDAVNKWNWLLLEVNKIDHTITVDDLT